MAGASQLNDCTVLSMDNIKPPGEPTLEEAMADVRTLARFALESDDLAVIKRDLEMILMIAEMVLPAKGRRGGIC